eukprot:2269061-Amphidinium_carterae.1
MKAGAYIMQGWCLHNGRLVPTSGVAPENGSLVPTLGRLVLTIGVAPKLGRQVPAKKGFLEQFHKGGKPPLNPPCNEWS